MILEKGSEIYQREQGKPICNYCKKEFSNPRSLQRHAPECSIANENMVEVGDPETSDSTLDLTEKNFDGCYITTPILKQYGLFLHKEYHFAYCKHCGTPVIFDKLENHFRSKHNHRLPDKISSEFLKLECGTPVNSLEDERIAKFSPLSTESHLVEGLSVKTGWECLHCFYCYTSKKYMIEHIKDTHNHEYSKDMENNYFRKCFVQTIFRKPLQYYKVHSGTLTHSK